MDGWQQLLGFLFVNRVATYRTIRVVIAEDHTLMAQGLRKLLESEFECVSVVGNGRALLDTVALSKPDVALVDIVMPLLNGIEATRQLGKISPATKVIIVTAHTEPQYVIEAFRAGASGYVLKHCAVSELVTAIRCVLAGQTYFKPPMADQAVEAARESALGRALTSRQREVLQLVAAGCTAKEIANSAETLCQDGSVPQDGDHGEAGIAHHRRTDAVRPGARDHQDKLRRSGKGHEQHPNLLDIHRRYGVRRAAPECSLVAGVLSPSGLPARSPPPTYGTRDRERC